MFFFLGGNEDEGAVCFFSNMFINIYIYTYVILIKVKLKVRFAVSYNCHIKFTIFLVIGATFWKKGEFGVSLSSGSLSLELPSIFLAT